MAIAWGEWASGFFDEAFYVSKFVLGDLLEKLIILEAKEFKPIDTHQLGNLGCALFAIFGFVIFKGLDDESGAFHFKIMVAISVGILTIA
jgi:hypothetical protein